MMQYPKLSDTHTGNTQMEILFALLYGGKCLGYETIEVTDAAVKTLDLANNFPDKRYAILYLESSGAEADSNLVIRWREDGAVPTAAEGMPLGNNGTLDIKGDNIANFQAIGIDAGQTHKIRVQYYGKG